MEEMKFEGIKTAGPIKTGNIILPGSCHILRSEQNLKVSEVVFKLPDYTPSPSLCRLCAATGKDMIHMFGPNRLYKNIIKKIEHCLPITVKKTDTLPKDACQMCLEKLELFYQFYTTVAEAEKQLLMLDRQTLSKLGETEGNCQTSSLCNGKCSSIKHASNKEKFKSLSETCRKNNLRKNSRGSRSSSDTDKNTNSSMDSSNSGQTSISHIEHSLGRELRSKKQKSDTKLSSSQFTRNKSHTASDSLHNEARKDTSDDDILFWEEKFKDQIFSGQSVDCKIIKCQICREAFATAERCHLHASIHAWTNYYPCCFCDKTLTTEREWKKHSLEHIMESNKFKSREAIHDCNECGKKFVTESRLKFHKLFHKSTTEINSTTQVADRSLWPLCQNTPQHLSDRTRKNSRGGRLTRHNCKERNKVTDVLCNGKFDANVALKVHRGTSCKPLLTEKKFLCAHCGKAYTRKGHLIIHMRSHTRERPYSCAICSKKFVTKTVRNNHRRMHTGERPFKCSICGETFVWAESLKQHATLHAGKMMPYKCTLCDQSFAKIRTRNNHMNVHTGEKPYQCDLCGTCFKEKRVLRRHEKAKHGEDVRIKKCKTGCERDCKISNAS